MTNWIPDLSARTGPRYVAIANAMWDAISRGDLAPGAKLPPQRDLAWKLGVTVGTVSRAYMLAEQRGHVSGEVGRGTYVKPPRIDGSLLGAAQPAGLDLTRNAPSSTLHAAAIREALVQLSTRNGLERLLHYMPEGGHPDHRLAGAQWLGRIGLEVVPEQVVVTGGAQQAIAAVLSQLAEPGETVLCEQLTYCGLMDAARLFRIRLEGVAMDEQGMLPDALDEAARERNARVAVVVPTIQNPTAATMSLARRREIVAVARARDLTLVEDDVYGYLPANRPETIASLAPERTVYLASASKCIAPGLRVGWIACPPALVERFAGAVHGMSIALPALPAEIVRMWIADGTAARITEHLRLDTANRQTLAAEIFAGFVIEGDPASFHILLHLPEPWRREEFTAAARAQGVNVVPASTFAVGRATAPHAVRISLAAPPDLTTLREGLVQLRDLALARPSGRRAII